MLSKDYIKFINVQDKLKQYLKGHLFMSIKNDRIIFYLIGANKLKTQVEVDRSWATHLLNELKYEILIDYIIEEFKYKIMNKFILGGD